MCSKPRRATSKPEDIAFDSDTSYLSRARWIWTIKLGISLVALDALGPETASDPTYAEDSLLIFARVLCGCLAAWIAETLAFHSGILFSCFVILRALSLFKQLFSSLRFTTSAPSSDESTPPDFNLALIPLTLFYSSLTKLFLLFLLTIWTPHSPSPPPSPASYPQIQSSWFNTLRFDPTSAIPSMLSDLSKVLDDDRLDREWVIRNILGGMSAGFGLRVILDIHPFFSTLIILSGWASKTAMAQIVGEWVGGGTQMSQAWLAHSIP
ncbi:hypothetical protein D9756_002978 [Leucocoprinus leucothites]|uniref:Uncharacterized protein n=1 Tax=Leucocoprinus leucothites TaxID=201217 RepID=A0A8H5G6X6_9AGAR|nr:hypothetical protein D9756_002978 [Leucoagaricus leucothites]